MLNHWTGKNCTYNLIGVGTNAKTVKGDGKEYLTAILYLAPHTIATKKTLCPFATKAKCFTGCLYGAGRGQMNSVQESRIRKAKLFSEELNVFIALLAIDLGKFLKYCMKNNKIPVVRLNGTSDIDWMELRLFGKNIFEMFPTIQFYDYTKVYKRVVKDLPENYHLTLSYSEANIDYAANILGHAQMYNKNIAVVFRDKKNIPATFKGMSVIDGDKDDLRFLDASDKPHVVALYAKGGAKKDTSGFVID